MTNRESVQPDVQPPQSQRANIAPALRAGDEQAWRKIMERFDYFTQIAATAGSPDPENSAQQGVVDFWQHISDPTIDLAPYDLPGPVNIAVFRSATSELEAEKREKRGGRMKIVSLDSLREEEHPTHPDMYFENHTWNTIIAALNQLPPGERTAIALHGLLGYTIAEIVTLSGVPLNKIRRLEARARRKLLRLLRDRPYETD